MIRFLSDSEILLKAAINRIAARISEKMIKSVQELSEISEDLPQQVRKEWSNFKDEVIEESERLEKKTNSSKERKKNPKQTREDLIQDQIDNLRSKVIEINKNIEENN